ncbi:MAG: porin family protein [Bacteroidales bacterium]|jgi:hypothetical protein|nr:porin family protein [Bacteroidales bacterium]MCI2121310.1 porin family protein [Bacteroidales bacterium]MCI2145200.1 porin family protein [Bacteroidales bacterium]
MKKILLTLALLCAVMAAGNAQPRAIGVRLGYGADFSYQQSASRNNMWDITVGGEGKVWDDTKGYWLSASFMYDWVWNIQGGFNWYAGPGFGIGLGMGSYSDDEGTYAINVGGQIGIEYEFASLPLNLSLDYRPMYNVLGTNGDNLYYAALGIRYRF